MALKGFKMSGTKTGRFPVGSTGNFPSVEERLATDRAERVLLDALRSKDPQAITEATVRYAITQPETIDEIRLALHFAPVLAWHVGSLLKLPPRLRRGKLENLWDLHIGPLYHTEHLHVRKVAIDAAMEVLAEKPRAKKP